MKNFLLCSTLSLGLITGLNAYELNGDLGVTWTGFKYENKTAVNGTFKDIELTIDPADDLTDFLTSAEVVIKTQSLESSDPIRNENMTSTLFSLLPAKLIIASILNVNEQEKKLTLFLTLNEVSKAVPMTYKLSNGKIIAKGSIDILDFNMESSFLAFAKRCEVHHQNKTFSDVNIAFVIPYK